MTPVTTTLWIAEPVEIQVLEECFSARVAVGLSGVPDPITGMIVNLKDLKPWTRGCLGVFVHRFQNFVEVGNAWMHALQKNLPLLDIELLREFALTGAVVETDQQKWVWHHKSGFDQLSKGSLQMPHWEQKVWQWQSSDKSFELRNSMSQVAYRLKA